MGLECCAMVSTLSQERARPQWNKSKILFDIR